MGQALGYEDGDAFVSINGKEIPTSGIQEYINETMEGLVVGEPLKVVVSRLDDEGKEYETTLQAPVQKVERYSAPSLTPSEGAGSQELALRKAWLGDNG